MTQLGADPDHLRGVARSLRAAAGRLDALSIELARRLRSTEWRGPDAASFTRQWQAAHGPALAAAAGSLAEVARRTEREANEQERASAGGAIPAPPLGDRPSVSPPARREDRFQGALDVRVGPVLTTLSGDLAIHHLDGDRRRVVLGQTAGAGATVGVGSAVDVGIGGPAGVAGIASGGSADARARAGVVLRRSWELDAHEIDDLLARVALEHGAGTTLRVHDPLERAAAVLDHAVEWVTGTDPGLETAARVGAGVPEPHRTERLVEVELSGTAAMGLGAVAGGGARAHGVSALRVGRGAGRSGSSTLVEYHGAATGALTSSLVRRLGISLPPDTHRGAAVRIELPDRTGPDAPGPALVRITSTTDTTLHDVVARVELGGPHTGGTRPLADAVVALRRGDPGAAVAHLDRLSPATAQVTVTSTTGSLSGHTARAGATAGAGLGAGVTLRGHGLRVDRSG
jgi:hypothetical protein